MTNLFKKAAIFTDIHFGAKGNSDIHNTDCVNFIQWMITKAKSEGCETCLFLGDYHNNRNAMNLRTMSFALQGLELLSKNFDTVYFIPGNHDLFYRTKRDIQSVEWAKHLPNVVICNDWTEIGDTVIAPWLVGDDYLKLKTLSGKYMFGHFELPGYFMNAMIQMPDHGTIQRDDMNGFEHVFSGHFHKRQSQNNVTYIGNTFPHNFSDAGDDERGLTVLEWGKSPVFHAWPNQPRYRVYNLSDVVSNTENLLQKDMHVRIMLDISISYEESKYIKESFIDEFGLRELSLLPIKTDAISANTMPDNVKFESIDTIVANQINAITSDQFNQKLLLDIYQNL